MVMPVSQRCPSCGTEFMVSDAIGDLCPDCQIVGHKTFDDGAGGFRHEPLTKREGDALWAGCEAAAARRAADMPTEQDALRAMGRAHQRLTELGWRDAIYCPKDGLRFQAIEPGSTGIHDCIYDGEWPKGTWWVHDGDTWPSRPCLFKLYPEDQAKEDARMAAAQARCAVKLPEPTPDQTEYLEHIHRASTDFDPETVIGGPRKSV